MVCRESLRLSVIADPGVCLLKHTGGPFWMAGLITPRGSSVSVAGLSREEAVPGKGGRCSAREVRKSRGKSLCRDAVTLVFLAPHPLVILLLILLALPSGV